MKKRKRGRPVGEFGRRGSVMGLRLPTELRELLEQAAAESGRTISGELLWRLSLTFRGHERGKSMGQMVADTEKALKAVVQAHYALHQFTLNRLNARRKR